MLCDEGKNDGEIENWLKYLRKILRGKKRMRNFAPTLKKSDNNKLK